jgi:copper chaperone
LSAGGLFRCRIFIEFNRLGEKYEERGKEMRTIKIQGMTCQHCVMSVTKALGSISGIKNLKVDLVKGEATFENTQNASAEVIHKAVEDAGYKVAE